MKDRSRRPQLLDGMLLVDFPGPKGQIHYDKGPPDFFCDTFELLVTYLSPEEQKRIRAMFTQDMAKADWNKPVGSWIDARSALYVFGSDMKGSMGPTAASFARREDAEAFARQHGGKVVRFEEITPAMVSLDGGGHGFRGVERVFEKTGTLTSREPDTHEEYQARGRGQSS